MKMQWKIGNVEIPNPFVLAPMAGVTDLAFRRLCKEQGAGLICMEMVSAKAISFHNKNTEALMEIDPGEHPVSMQLFGSEPDLMSKGRSSMLFATSAIRSGSLPKSCMDTGCSPGSISISASVFLL